MNKSIIYLMIICCVVFSCTKEKTDYDNLVDSSVDANPIFKEVVVITSNGHQVRLEALNGELYTGYNEFRIKIYDGKTALTVSKATFTPILVSKNAVKIACPHGDNLTINSANNFLSGYVVFTEAARWQLYIQYTVDGKTYSASKEIDVKAQPNKNLNFTHFLGNDGKQYVIALKAPQNPKVGENKLVADIYHFDDKTINTIDDFSYLGFKPVYGYTLLLDPRMPEPSMGNHSSPNNQDLIQQQDGTYAGVVNYTMTGNWTLNFRMLNASGVLIKGTEVSTAYTPGLVGQKSELFIDILF